MANDHDNDRDAHVQALLEAARVERACAIRSFLRWLVGRPGKHEERGECALPQVRAQASVQIRA